jgi:cell division protein FtsI (penicillin-binding protein 3)
VKIGHRLGAEAYHDLLRRFGFGAPTGSGFPDESAGLLRAAHRWRPVDHANVAFGQGLSVTPIQLAAALGAIANEGLWSTPRLVAARRRAGAPWQPVEAPPPQRVMRAAVARAVLGMLEQAVGPEGTGRRAALKGVRVAGKTGTAQKLDRQAGRYSDERYLAWFAGAVPADDPRLVVVVMLDEPRGEAHTGGAVAAPVFARVAAAQLARLGVATSPELAPDPPPALPPTRIAGDEEAPAPGTPALPTVSASEGGEAESAPAPHRVEIARMGDRLLLPDFRGLRPDEVARITEGLAFVVEMVGEGLAVAQEPAPGTVVAASGATLHLRFENVEANESLAGDEG